MTPMRKCTYRETNTINHYIISLLDHIIKAFKTGADNSSSVF